jgi:transposase
MNSKDQIVVDVVAKILAGKLSRKVGCKVLGVSERTLRRYLSEYAERGILFVQHRNTKKTPVNKTNLDQRKLVLSLVTEKYFDFNLTHCLEKLKSDHGIEVGRETFRSWCHEIGMVKKARRRSAKVRRKRDRMAQAGLMLQMDGSPHRWFGGKLSCLIAAIDDADSDIPYGEFFPAEDTISCMVVLQKIIEKKGIFQILYVDRAGIFGGPKRCNFSQVKRAVGELGIHVIFANSPEAKGRIERNWGTLQDRLIPEMRIRNITTYNSANDFLQNQYLPNEYLPKFKVIPESLESAYKPIPADKDLNEIFCLKNHRGVKRDHTFSWHGEIYSIISPLKHSIYRQKIEIRTYQNLQWKVFFAGKELEVKLAKLVKKVSPSESIKSACSNDNSKVRLDGHVQYKSRYYSVPEKYIGQLVNLSEQNGRVLIYQNATLIESHSKLTLDGQISSTKPEHLGPWKRCLEPESFYRKSARRYGANVEKLVVSVIEQGSGFIDTGTIFGILGLDKNYPATAINAACGVALELGQSNYRAVKSILKLHDTRTYEEKIKHKLTK